MEHLNPPESARIFAPGTPVAVVVEGGLDRPLDYRAPAGGVRAGDLVEVPLGPRRLIGLVWGGQARVSTPPSCATSSACSTRRRWPQACVSSSAGRRTIR